MKRADWKCHKPFWGAHAPRVLLAAPSPQFRTFGFYHAGGSVDAGTVGEAPTGTREGACAPPTG